MKRRDIFKGTGLLAASTAIAQPALAQTAPTVNWRIVTAVPKSQRILFQSAVNMAEIVESLTDGKFKIQIFQPGEIVPALASYDAVQDGTVEMAYTASYFSMGKDPTFALGSAVAFGGNSRMQRSWFDHGGLEMLNKFYEKDGTIMFPGGNTGAQMAGWFRKEIKSKEDLVGLKMRVAGMGGMVLAKLGVIPQQIATGDVYASLERGTIDAAEVTGPYDDENFGFAKVAPYYYFPSFSEGSVAMNFFVALDKWKELPASYQEAIRMACNYAADVTLSRYDSEQIEPLRRLIASGVQLRQIPTDILEAALPATKEVYEEMSQESDDFREIYAHYMHFVRDIYQWWQVSEYNYDTMMMQALNSKRL